MKTNNLKKIFNQQIRIQSVPEGYHRQATEEVIRHVSLYGEKGFISYSDLTKENAEEIIERELNYFKEIKQNFEWKVFSYDQPENLVDLLESKGFHQEDPEALMVMEITSSHPLLQYDTSHVKEIVDKKGIQEIIQLEDQVWNYSHEDLGERLWRDKQMIPDYLYLYGVYEKGNLVSAAWMYMENQTSFTSLWGGSTLLDFRGKGHYTSLLAARAKKAYEEGYPYLTVDASSMSRVILEKNGFQFLGYSYGCQSPSIN